MIESNLVEGMCVCMMNYYASLTNVSALAGRQDIPDSGRAGLQDGKSVTDGTSVHYGRL